MGYDHTVTPQWHRLTLRDEDAHQIEKFERKLLKSNSSLRGLLYCCVCDSRLDTVFIFSLWKKIYSITPGHKPGLFFRISWAFSFFCKIFAFCPNLLIFFQWKLKVHTFQILSCVRRGAHTRAPIFLWMLEIYWNSQNRRIFRKYGFGARSCLRARAQYKIWKVWILSFQ